MQQFTPLPLRVRSVLELIDTSLKVYKQYFLVLLAWSAGIHVLGVLPAIVPTLAFLSSLAVLLTPFKLSVAACCIAGAVRGQDVTFRQCWDFTKPRFGPMLGWMVVSWIIGFLGFMLSLVPGALLLLLGAGVAGIAGAALGVAGVVFGFMFFFAAISIGMTFMFAWSYMVPLVVCMEEGRSSQGPLARTWALLRGNWGRLTGLMLVLGMAVMMVMLAMGAAGAWSIGLDEARRQITGGMPSPEFMQKMIGASIGISFIMTFFDPAMMLAMVLFYLDVRVRQEALDLEWSAHQSQPIEDASAGQFQENAMAPPAASPMQSAFPTPIEPIGVSPNDFMAAPAAPFDAAAFDAPVGLPDLPDAPPDAPVVWRSIVEEMETPLDAAPMLVAAPLPGEVATIACPKCGAMSPATSTFCMTCGALLKSDA